MAVFKIGIQSYQFLHENLYVFQIKTVRKVCADYFFLIRTEAGDLKLLANLWSQLKTSFC